MRRSFLVALCVSGCAKEGVVKTDVDGCSDHSLKRACVAATLDVNAYAFRAVGRRYVYALRRVDARNPAPGATGRVRAHVAATGKDRLSLVTEGELIAARKSREIALTERGIEVADRPYAPPYVVFRRGMLSVEALAVNREVKVPFGTFADTVETLYVLDERPEGGKRFFVSDRMVFAKGVGIVRRELDLEKDGLKSTTTWELASIEEPKE